MQYSSSPSHLSPGKRLLAWLGGHDKSVLITFASIAAGIWIFGELADQVLDGGTRAIDRRLLLAFRVPGTFAPLGGDPAESAARDVTALGGVIVLTLITFLTSAFLALDGKRRMAGFLVFSVSGGIILSTVLKAIFHRPRPDLVPHLTSVVTSSFPSGHSMMSATTYLTLGALLAAAHNRRILKAFFLLSACLLTLMVGVSRVYLGVHWPSDVVAGWTAGAVWAIICRLAWDKMQSRRRSGSILSEHAKQSIAGPADSDQKEHKAGGDHG